MTQLLQLCLSGNKACVCTSASCDLAISTSVLAAGWTISKVFNIVAPSLDMVALPANRKDGTWLSRLLSYFCVPST